MSNEIVVTISAGGEAKVEVKGYTGPGCKDLTRQLEAALGATTSDIKTREYYQADRAHQRQGQKT